MNRLKLVICDEDEIYCRRLDEFLRSNLGLGFDIFSFTDYDLMEKFINKTKASLLMIAESALEGIDERRLYGHVRNMIVLDEGLGGSSIVMDQGGNDINKKFVSKYQPASMISKEIVSFCADDAEEFSGLGIEASPGKGKVLSLYSPLSKCGQTTLAVNISEKLAQGAKVIFLSFESFSTLPQILGVTSDEDITDLMYYADLEPEKFGLYLQKIKKTKNGVDYVMPARTAMQIKEIDCVKVKQLYNLLANECGYDYIVVDLTEHPGDFFDIAALSNRLITITRQYSADQYKIKLFEDLLLQGEMEELREKLVKCRVPDIRDRSEYNDFIEGLLISEGITDGSEA